MFYYSKIKIRNTMNLKLEYFFNIHNLYSKKIKFNKFI